MAQLEAKLRELQQEYLVPTKKIKYFTQQFAQVLEMKNFVLPAL